MANRGRPKKQRLIQNFPKIYYFSPRGRAGRPDEVILGIDELEALRWSDLQNLSQKESAKMMGVSQQTFSRILNKARKILADAIINGKIIKIHGPA